MSYVGITYGVAPEFSQLDVGRWVLGVEMNQSEVIAHAEQRGINQLE